MHIYHIGSHGNVVVLVSVSKKRHHNIKGKGEVLFGFTVCKNSPGYW